jgi:hypothetical protein
VRVAFLVLGLLAAALLGGGLGSAVTTLNSPTVRSVIAEPTSSPNSSAPVVPVTVTATVGATRTATVTRTAVATQTRTLVALTTNTVTETNTVTTTPRTADSDAPTTLAVGRTSRGRR